MLVSKAFIDGELQLIFLGATREQAFQCALAFLDENPDGVNIKFCADDDGDMVGKIRFPTKVIEIEELNIPAIGETPDATK